MEASKSVGGARKLEQDKLVDKLVPDASQVPDVQVLAGFLGKSTREGYWRLYLTITLNEYVEFAEEDVVHSHAFESDESLLGGTAVWIRRGANLQHTQSVSREAQADFLQGAITASALGRPGTSGRARRGPAFVQAGPQHAKIFLSFAGHANSCVSDLCDHIVIPSWWSGGDVVCTFNCQP